jgi:putative aldouronate transport system permease protein
MNITNKTQSTIRIHDVAKKITFENVVINFTFLLYSAVCIFPLLLVVAVSLTDEKTITQYGYNFIPKKFSLDAFSYLFKSSNNIVNSYGVSTLVTVVGTSLSVLIIAMLAYPLSRKDFKYRKAFSFFIFFTMLFNGGLVPWYIICVRVLHLKNSLMGLIFPYLVNAWYVMILRTFFASAIPDAVLESAKIDGAGEWLTFFKIVLPLSLPGLATIALFSTLTYWNDWWLSLIFITKEKYMPLQYLLMRVQMSIQFLANSNTNSNLQESLSRMPQETLRMAMCVAAIGPIIFAYPFFQKYFIKGLTVGAVKG